MESRSFYPRCILVSYILAAVHSGHECPDHNSDVDPLGSCSPSGHTNAEQTNLDNLEESSFEQEDLEVLHSVWTKDSRHELGEKQEPPDFPAPKWEKYFNLVTKALNVYIPCGISSDSTGCFAGVIDKDLGPYKTLLGITEEMIERAVPRGVVYQIIGHKLFRQKECMFPTRCAGVEHFLVQLVSELPDMEFIVNVQDYPQVSIYEPRPFPVFSFSKTAEFQDILYPAWTFWAGGPVITSYPRGLGRWDLIRDRIEASAEKYPWDAKLPLGFFRGSRTSAERDPLVVLSRAKPDLVDAKYTKNQAWRSEADTLGEKAAAEISLEDHCKYKFLFNFRGVAASFRLKHLFLCDSLVFNVDSDWIEFFYPAMKAWVHYIPVRKDLSDVEELLQFARENDALVQQIASRGKEFIFRHLKMENVEEYWRKILMDYGSLLRYRIKRRENLVEILPS